MVQAVAPVGFPVLSGEVSSSQLIVRSFGQFIVGPEILLTRITCRQLVTLPQASVAVQVRSIRPSPEQSSTPLTTSE